MIPVAGVYLGGLAVLLGIVTLLRPLPAVGLTSRAHGVAVVLAGLLVAATAAALPAPDARASTRTRLDEYVPRYQFSERHTIRIQAPPDAAYRAIQAVTADEIRLFQTLTWIRRFGRRGPESILHAPGRQPLLDVATRTTFLRLAEEPGRELVVGTLVAAPRGWTRDRAATPAAFQALAGPGFAKAAMNFRVEPDGRGGSVVTTETRVFATDAPTRRRFAIYWRVIYPGSALIRRSWLAAIRRRAEWAGAGRASE